MEISCHVSDTKPDRDVIVSEPTATGLFEDGKYYICPIIDFIHDAFNRWGLVADNYMVGDYTKVYINGEEIDYPNYPAKWIKTAYTYEVKEEDSLDFNKGKIDGLVLTIDGDYTLFESLKIGDLKLEKDTDYTVTKGSTIITFTEAGIAKLNILAKGNYDVEVKYTNGKTVTTKLVIEELKNPKTGIQELSYGILGAVMALGIIALVVYKKKLSKQLLIK